MAKAQNIYKNTLLEISLEKLSSDEFKKRLEQGKPLQSSKGVILTNKDQGNLREALLDLRQESKENYSRAVSEMPLLAFLNKGNPGDTELETAFSKLENRFKKVLEEIKDPKTNTALLLAHESLVEELLGEDKSFCLVAELARQKVEKSEARKDNALLAGGLLSAVPCFVTGTLLSPACLASGAAFGALSVRVAGRKANQSMDRFLTGKDYETLASLEEQDKAMWMETALFPLAFLGTTARPVKLLLRTAQKALTAFKREVKTYFKKDKAF